VGGSILVQPKIMKNENREILWKKIRKALDKDQFSFALELLKEYLSMLKNSSGGWFSYGDCCRHIGRLQESETSLRKSLKYIPRADYLQTVQLALGITLVDKGKFQQAEKYFSMATLNRKFASESYMWILRGNNFMHMEKFQKAERCFRKALPSKSCDKSEAFHNLGRVFLAQGDYKQATKYFIKALKLDPKLKASKNGLKSMEGIFVD